MAFTLGIGRGIVGYPRFLWNQLRAWRQDVWIIALATILGVVLMVPIAVHTVPSGSVGVVWKRFGGGTDLTDVYPEGTVVIMPWNKLFLYETRIQSGENKVSALSADGLKVDVDLAWAFYLVPQSAALVHKGIGPDYKDKVVVRVIESVVRDKISLFKSEELHSPERTTFEKNVFAGVSTEITHFNAINRLDPSFKPADGDALSVEKGVEWINLEAVLIKEIRFPPAVQEAYIRKNTARALVDEYNFRITAEQKEVERKMVEALGIRNFQEVVNKGLSETYLKWKGIEANVATAMALAQSPNAKLVVMGPGAVGSGMPMILNTNALDAMGSDVKADTKPKASVPALDAVARGMKQPPAQSAAAEHKMANDGGKGSPGGTPTASDSHATGGAAPAPAAPASAAAATAVVAAVTPPASAASR
jgi:regulator of protease activity HflC (stomatin/prohibitin superfamily)